MPQPPANSFDALLEGCYGIAFVLGGAPLISICVTLAVGESPFAAMLAIWAAAVFVTMLVVRLHADWLKRMKPWLFCSELECRARGGGRERDSVEHESTESQDLGEPVCVDAV